MTKRTAIVPGLLLIAAIFPAFAKDTTYRDPRSPSWTMLVPDGWTASRTDQGVILNHGNTAVMVWVVRGSRPAADVLTDVGSQFQKQAKNFKQIERGECQLGGEKGAYMMFSGISPNGTAEISRLVAMTNGQMVYTMLMQTRPDQYDDEKATWQRIQDSFAPEAPVKSVDDREKLDALYAAGVINQQEYEARKKNLGGNSASTAVPPGNGNNAGQPSAGSSIASPRSDADAQKLAALDQAYRSGVLTQQEYESKKQQLVNPNPAGAPSSAATASSAAAGNSNGETNRFRAPDNSFSTLVPPGWTSERTWSGGQATDVFFPTGGGNERIAISSMRAMVSMPQMAAGLNNITANLFPGLRLAGDPLYGQMNGNPATELRYQGMLANGMAASAWYGVILHGGKYYSVFCIAGSQRAAAVEGDAQIMFRNLNPGPSR